ncbi:MAG: Hsp20/alpha crystallin family protein [Patescibacteria group bacterium]
MDDEKFFEELVKEKSSAESEFGVGLAKAEVAPAATATRAIPVHKAATAPKYEEGEAEGQLAIDVYQTPSDIIIESAIAGVKPEDMDITVTHDSVTIKGERRRAEESRGSDYFYQECYWGRFSRAVILPQEVDPENAQVSFRNGILTIVLPKINRKKQKKLRVKVE